MSLPAGEGPARPLETAAAAGPLQRLVDHLHAVLIWLSALAIGAAGCVLTWEVAGRYFFKIPSDWQDELSVFLLVGASFLSAGWIQARRGHVAIETLAHLLPPSLERWRRAFADLASFAFCLFFTWKCWALLLEAWDEGQTTDTAWGPPIWIPYGLMTAGMSVLAAQLLLQLAAHFAPSGRR